MNFISFVLYFTLIDGTHIIPRSGTSGLYAFRYTLASFDLHYNAHLFSPIANVVVYCSWQRESLYARGDYSRESLSH